VLRREVPQPLEVRRVKFWRRLSARLPALPPVASVWPPSGKARAHEQIYETFPEQSSVIGAFFWGSSANSGVSATGSSTGMAVTHNPKVAGSNPAHDLNPRTCLCWSEMFACGRLCRILASVSP
jgi:hypothetical protein